VLELVFVAERGALTILSPASASTCGKILEKKVCIALQAIDLVSIPYSIKSLISKKEGGFAGVISINIQFYSTLSPLAIYVAS
jgi:hypothetical protein